MVSYSPTSFPRLEGTVATQSCEEGHGLVGGPDRTCGASGTWSGSVITCHGKLILKLQNPCSLLYSFQLLTVAPCLTPPMEL